ncbi:phage integrase SAM-like domain-containing protein [Runella sp.]|uniref:phage integrase SAM-like domain-containing protein n=1 Tax=Runella sp. TaxID=1960881 RepID=UPI003016E375
MNLFQKKKPFAPFIRERIALIEAGQIFTKTGKKYSYAGRHRLVGVLHHLEAYEKIAGIAYAEQMHDQWFQNFLSYLTSLGLKKNTIHSNLNAFKMALRKCCKQFKLPYLVDEFSYGPEITTQIFNSVEEIDAMIALDLAGTALDAIRDAYVIQCYTGLRRGDLKVLLSNPKQFIADQNGKKYFRIVTSKTDTVVVIPVSNKILNILERRDWRFKSYSIQLYNRGIKKVGQLAGLIKPIEIQYTKNGQKTKEIQPKYELMSSHTARRSFATNAFLAGIPTLKIRQITGHTTESSFMVYIRADGMQSAQTIVDDPFFR